MGAILTHTKYGPMLCAPRDPYMSVALTANGCFSPDQFAGWKPYLKAGGVVVEVGAHVGAHTMAFAEAVGPDGGVIAFEPQWMPYAMLCGSLALNGHTHVRAHRMAVGKESGMTMIPTHDFSQAGNFGATKVGDGEPVPLVSLDSFSIAQCDFLKVDVEGMELDVLQGAEQLIAACRPVIGCEAEKNDDAKRIGWWLRERNYRVRRFVPRYGVQWPNLASFDVIAVPEGREFYENPDLGEWL